MCKKYEVNPDLEIERKDLCELIISQKGKYSGRVRVYDVSGEAAKKEAQRLAKELRDHILEVNRGD